ncbi:MAG: phosphoribosyl-ATP diphosphatase [Chloroflexi bacterium]|nr:MAG: phosphoribosyl-ATP diphosphatase [Chloroflexota bacterium]
MDILDSLMATLQDRKANPSPNSYTTSLLEAGEDEIVKKIGEEAVEVIIAAKGQGDERVIEETADLLYHTLVLLVSRGLSLDDIRAELTSRHQK